MTANAKVATVLLGSIPASSDTADSEGRQKKQCLNYFKNPAFSKQIAYGSPTTHPTILPLILTTTATNI
jgi:hypothetical protein